MTKKFKDFLKKEASNNQIKINTIKELMMRARKRGILCFEANYQTLFITDKTETFLELKYLVDEYGNNTRYFEILTHEFLDDLLLDEEYFSYDEVIKKLKLLTRVKLINMSDIDKIKSVSHNMVNLKIREVISEKSYTLYAT